MNIFYIAHRIPYPPNKGEKVRAFHQIRYLSQRHSVHLACLIDEPQDVRHVQSLKEYCKSVDFVYRAKAMSSFLAASALLTGTPLSVRSFYSAELKEKIHQRIRSEKFDTLVVFSSTMAQYVRDVHGVRKIIDFVDLDSEKWRLYAKYHGLPLSCIYRLEATRLAQYEKEAGSAFDESIFISEEEASLFRRRVEDRPLSIISNGVDLDYFDPNQTDAIPSDPPVIVFTGSMDYLPNVDAVRDFCHRTFHLIQEISPKVQFYIVGRNPSRHVRELGRQVNVVVTGEVPDIRPYLKRATVAITPLRIARGVQNKILEAMAMGLPVVGTSNAFQGLHATSSDGIRIADDPEEFARNVVAFLQDTELCRKSSLQAKEYVRRNHSWEDHGLRLESLLKTY
jgi:sugar transferase (PEP-CTERM/EpsH1 system associated)